MTLLTTTGGRRFLFFALYLSEGAPIGFIWWALPTMLRSAGVEVPSITALTSVLVLPWIFKFLWAPLIDAVRTSRWSLRSWILVSQLLMGLSLVPLLVREMTPDLTLLAPLLLVHAIAAATQDAAIDALAIASTPNAERGRLNGWMQAGMLLGRSVLGGGALLLERLIGAHLVVLLLITVIWSSSVLVVFAGGAAPKASGPAALGSRLRGVGVRLSVALSRRETWLGLLFAAIGGAAFEGLGAVAGPFLIDRGFSGEEVGVFFALNSVLGMVAGAFVGGYLADRTGKRLAVFVSLGLVCASVLAVAALDAAAGSPGSLILLTAMTAFYVCIGAFTASSYALFMELTDPALGATQFSAFMAATNACESWSAFAVGRGIPLLGYPGSFTALAAVSLCALPLVRLLKREPGAGPMADRSPRH